jgi:hypothetical protein
VTRVAARAVHPPPPGKHIAPSARRPIRSSAGTTFRADEVEVLRILLNAVRVGNLDYAKRVVDCEAGLRASAKVLGMADRVRGKKP